MTINNVVVFSLGAGAAVVALVVFLIGELRVRGAWRLLFSAGTLAVVLMATLYTAGVHVVAQGAGLPEALPYVTFRGAGLLLVGASIVGVTASFRVRGAGR